MFLLFLLLVPEPLTCTSSSSMWTSSGQYPTGTPLNEESGPLAIDAPLTGHEPNLLDDFHCSETTEIFLQEQSSDAVPSCLHDAELSDETIGRALSSPLFIQERQEPAGRRQAYHSFEESLLPSQSLSVCHVRTGRPLHELSSPGSRSREKPSRDSENEQIRILFERQKEQILDDYRAEIHKHEFQADFNRRSIQELSGIIESQRREIDHTHARDEQLRRDQLLRQEQLLKQNRDLREGHMKSLNEMEELKRIQGATFDEFSRRRLIEDRDTILELTGKIQELQNEINCMNDSRDFQDAESLRSGQFPRYQSSSVFPTFSKSWRNAKPFSGNAEPQHWAAKYLGHAWYIGKRFCKSSCVFFSTLSAGVQSMDLQCVRTHITTCTE